MAIQRKKPGRKKKKVLYFHEEDVFDDVISYVERCKNEDIDLVLRNMLVEKLLPIAKGMIKANSFDLMCPPIDDLLQECAIKITKDLHKYKPERATIFNFISIICKNHLITFINNAKKKKGKEIHFDEKYFDEVTGEYIYREDFEGE